jgi:hypothetical protein
MKRSYQTAVEKWDVLHPGLRADVDRMLAQRRPGREIHDVLREKYGVLIAERTVNKYKQNRWYPAAQRIEEYEAAARGILKAFGKDPNDLDFNWFLNLVLEVSRDRLLIPERRRSLTHKGGKSR